MNKKEKEEWIDLNGEAMIAITKKEYESLLEDSEKLEALEAAGVDNWEGYSDAMESLEEE